MIFSLRFKKWSCVNKQIEKGYVKDSSKECTNPDKFWSKLTSRSKPNLHVVEA